MSRAARAPRGASGRSWSRIVASSQLDFAWRSRCNVLTWVMLAADTVCRWRVHVAEDVAPVRDISRYVARFGSDWEAGNPGWGGGRGAEAVPPGRDISRYVARFASDWEADNPRWWEMDGTLVFVDISGFTNLSERLTAFGRIGAEE